MATKNKFISIELDFADEQLSIWKSWMEKNPYEAFKDRITWKETKGGGSMPITSATIETQQKNFRETLKDYLSMCEVVKKLREEEVKKIQMRKGFEGNDILDDTDNE